MSEQKVFPCVCCGYQVFADPPGSHLICPVCFWEDDRVQTRWPMLAGGANRLSLAECQQRRQSLGVGTPKADKAGRLPTLDPGFRPIDLTVDAFEDQSAQDRPWPEDLTDLYWWRPTFWRHRPGAEPEGFFSYEFRPSLRKPLGESVQ